MDHQIQDTLPFGRATGRRRSSRLRAFTIVELLAATTIFAIILAVIFGITQQISSAWKNSSAKIEAFQGARGAFTAMTQQVSQATLNTYYDYYDSSGNRRGSSSFTTPHHYGRYSDLHFICGGWAGTLLVPGQVTQAIFFQAPMGYAESTYAGMDTLLNACGYYIVYSQDSTRPAFLDNGSLPRSPANQYRFRLMQFLQPSQKLTIYPYTTGKENDWFTKAITPPDPPAGTPKEIPPVRILAENIIALVVYPKLSKVDEDKLKLAGSPFQLTGNFDYNSRPKTINATQQITEHQLPPVVEIIMVALDEPSAQRICTSSSMPDFGLSGGLASLFKNVASLEDSGGAPGDITKLTKALDTLHLTYHVFRSQVAIRGAKWSNQ